MDQGGTLVAPAPALARLQRRRQGWVLVAWPAEAKFKVSRSRVCGKS